MKLNNHIFSGKFGAGLRLLVFLAVMLTAGGVRAQDATYKFDLGAGIGMSGYAGDASPHLFTHPGVQGELTFRYLPNTRWAVRGVFAIAGISGDTKNMAGVLPGGAQYHFNSTVFDLGGRFEFNFFPYGIGQTYKGLRRWTPYLALGVGVTMATCKGSSAFGPNIPMAAGVKFKIKERVNVGVEFSVTKVFNDHIDGPDLSDLTTIKSSFLKNNDWYSRLTLSLTYEFGKRCETCHYVD